MGTNEGLQAVRKESGATRVRNGILGTFINTVLCLFSMICIFPLVWMLYSSFKNKREFNASAISLPLKPTFENYLKIFANKDANLIGAMGNSARTTLISVLLIVLFAFIVGYILSRVNFRLNRPLYVMFLMGMLIPIHSLLVPIYIIFNRTGMANQWYTLLFPYVAFNLPVAIFLVEGYVKGIPTELEEAAAIDGCSFSRTMFSIILPICRPILMTVAIINAFTCWNEFSFALVLISNNKAITTVPLALKNFTGQFSSDYPKMMAAMLITMAPVVILYFIFSKQIIKGMVAGAVKG
ncbi:MAG: carbohydrate ABC transporter permease [Lachnospiraceae bacterium]|nr:carbohydrate ABC transporter permease [Lachnospiraceae bacterium]